MKVYVLEIFDENLKDWIVDSVYKSYESAQSNGSTKKQEDSYCISEIELKE